MTDRASVALRLMGSRATLLGPENSLESINTTLLDDGAFCYVVAEHLHYELHRDDTTMPSPPAVIAPSAGPGRWVPATGGSQGFQGSQGSQGSQGAQGTQGAGFQGAQGAQGGTGVQGAQGTQGAGFQGAQGATGTQGSQGSQGAQGTQGAGFQGAQGAQGNTGAQGTQGTQGAGFQGAQGAQGNTGVQGAQGTQGAGFQGAQGFQGGTGVQGAQGTQGAGFQGAQGAQGNTGVQGSQGSQGAGLQGAQGFQGGNGVQGSQGSQGAGLQGAQGFQGGNGVQGSQGAQGAGLQGAQGFQGGNGAQGSQGAQGAGLQGAQGFQGGNGAQGATGSGAQGNQGAQGATGVQGNQGAQGALGTQGTQGFQGAAGLQGTQGFQGARGLQGFQGFQGNTGTTGAQGFQGATGTTGTTGTTGLQGAQGNTGTQGAQGFQGAAGTGAQGAQGNQGSQGALGAQGTQGFQGARGFQGFQGFQGNTGAQGAQGFQGGLGTQGSQGSQGSVFGPLNQFYYVDATNAGAQTGSIAQPYVSPTAAFAARTTGNITLAIAPGTYSTALSIGGNRNITIIGLCEPGDQTVTLGTIALAFTTTSGLTLTLQNITCGAITDTSVPASTISLIDTKVTGTITGSGITSTDTSVKASSVTGAPSSNAMRVEAVTSVYKFSADNTWVNGVFSNASKAIGVLSAVSVFENCYFQVAPTTGPITAYDTVFNAGVVTPGGNVWFYYYNCTFVGGLGASVDGQDIVHLFDGVVGSGPTANDHIGRFAGLEIRSTEFLVKSTGHMLILSDNDPEVGFAWDSESERSFFQDGFGRVTGGTGEVRSLTAGEMHAVVLTDANLTLNATTCCRAILPRNLLTLTRTLTLTLTGTSDLGKYFVDSYGITGPEISLLVAFGAVLYAFDESTPVPQRAQMTVTEDGNSIVFDGTENL